MDHFLVLDAAMEKVGLFHRELNALSIRTKPYVY